MGSTHAVASDLYEYVLEHLYINRTPPKPSDRARDMDILLGWVRKGVDPDGIADMIQGLGLMRDQGALKWIEPGTGMTLRVIAAKEDRFGRRHLGRTARDYWRRHQEREARKQRVDGLERFKVHIE